MTWFAASRRFPVLGANTAVCSSLRPWRIDAGEWPAETSPAGPVHMTQPGRRTCVPSGRRGVFAAR